MKRATWIRVALLGLSLTAALESASYATKCVPDPTPRCPGTIAPVTCNNGQTYSNQCYADADCANGCHRA